MLTRFWLFTILTLALIVGGVPSAYADDDATETPPATEAAEEETTGEPSDPYAVPEDASAAELVEFIESVSNIRQPAKTREEFIANLTKSREAVLEAATKVLAMNDVTDEQAVTAVKAKISSLQLLSRIGNEEAGKELETFITSLKDDPRPAIAKMMKLQALAAAAGNLSRASEEERQQFVKDVNKYLSGKDQVSREDLMLVMSAGQALEQAKASAEAASLYQEMGAIAAKSDDEQIKSYGKRFEGMARRVNLLGNKMDVFGPTLDGEEIKWDAYRGKVVLVDFWATWCGPCIAESPNLKENYDIYHSRGFDVVGVSLDDDRAKLDEFIEKREIPWTNIYDPDANGWENPLAEYYGVSGIPTVILVDKEGKVVSLNARGEELGRLLAELIGPANETNEDAGEETKE